MKWRVRIGGARAPRQACIAALIGTISAALPGCNTLQGAAGVGSPPSATVQDSGEVKYYPSDEPLKLALEYYERGDFGLAERYFQDAVTKAPKDATAWVGLAATYDRIGRFDLADQAYASAIKLAGETVQILNNQGYSYMLRGDLRRAKAKFTKAAAKEPTNPTIINNLALLDSSARFVRRAPAP